MAIRFVGKDPESPNGGCPAVFVDEETGDLLFQGEAVTDAAVLGLVDAHSSIGSGEKVVRLPARLRAIILEACGVKRADL